MSGETREQLLEAALRGLLRFVPRPKNPDAGPLWQRTRYQAQLTAVAAAEAALAFPRGARPEIICLCGSSRFVAEMAVLAWNLEKGGAIVLSLHLLPQWYPGLSGDHQAEAEGIAEAMDALHLKKIDLADSVVVVNIGGYIGSSTRNEIAYAASKGKPITYIMPPEVENAG